MKYHRFQFCFFFLRNFIKSALVFLSNELYFLSQKLLYIFRFVFALFFPPLCIIHSVGSGHELDREKASERETEKSSRNVYVCLVLEFEMYSNAMSFFLW